MDYIELQSNGLWEAGLAVGVVGVVLLLIGLIFLGSGAQGSFGFSMVAAVVLLLAYIMVASGIAQAKSERITAIQGQVRATYGLELTVEEAEELSYPEKDPGELPENKSRATGAKKPLRFGSTTAFLPGRNPDSLERRELSLVWVDGKMLLAEFAEGRGFDYLEPVR